MKHASLLVWLALSLASTSLAETATWQGEIAGVPAWVTVVSSNPIPAGVRSQPWWRWGNAETDAYIFAFENPQNPRMALVFSKTGDTPEARLYLRAWGALRIAFNLQGNRLELTNPPNPVLTLRPQSGGWLVNGKPNYRLTVLEDGLDCDLHVDPDGQTDIEITVGTDAKGDPLWQTNRRRPEADPYQTTRGCERFGANLRAQPELPFKAAPSIMPTFPFLGIGRESPDWFEQNPNPLYLDLRDYTFRFSPFPGFQNGGMYAINSSTYPPKVSFESPFVFYNFDSATRYAQLVVRGSRFPAGTPFGPEPYGLERTTFRYSWKTDSPTVWRYGLHLAGFYPYQETYQIGGQKFNAPSPANLTRFVVGQKWPMISFVEATEGYPGSEGIYFFSAQANEHWNWLSGTSDQPIAELETPYLPKDDSLVRTSDRAMPPGFRGEYSASYFRTPLLYLSPIDQRVHLSWAQGGLWNLGDGRVLRTKSLQAGPNVDSWILERPASAPPTPPPPRAPGTKPPAEDDTPRAYPGTLEQALYAVDGYLLYTGPDGVELRQASYQLQAFTLNPPADRASWQAFRDRVAPFSGRDPRNLRAWLQAFPGAGLRLPGAQLSQVRIISGGFQMVLSTPSPVSAALGLPNLPAGTHLLRYDAASRTWSRRQAAAPKLQGRLETKGARQFEPAWFRLSLENQGSLDYTGPAELWVGKNLVKSWDQLTIPGAGKWSEELAFSPTGAADQPVKLVLGKNTLELEPVFIEPSQRESIRQEFSGNPVALILLVMFLGGGLFSLWRAWRWA